MQHGTKGNPNAKVLIVGESYGETEARYNQPFVGASGMELDHILKDAGINPVDCFFTNVVNKRPDDNDMRNFFVSTEQAKKKGLMPIRGLYPDIMVLEGIERLQEVIDYIKPTVIVAFGNYSLWALTENDFSIGNAGGYKIPTGITKYRGSHLRSRFYDIPVLATYHPAAVLRQWTLRAIAVHDIRARVPKAFRGEWGDPHRDFIIKPSYGEVMDVLGMLLLKASTSTIPVLIATDIETIAPFIDCIGLAWSTRNALCIPIMYTKNREGYWSLEEEIGIFLMLKQLLEHPNVETVGQNFVYDAQYFLYYYNTRPNLKQDTMIAHNVCFPGTLMGLDYLSSMYCSYHKYWKEDGKEALVNQDDEQRWVYNCRDCVATFEVIEEVWKVIKYYGFEMQYAIQMARVVSTLDMMVNGIRVDEKLRGEEQIKHIEFTMDIENRLDEMLPESVYPRPKKVAPWFRSKTQQATIFYDLLGVPEVYHGKTGNRTVDDEALVKIGQREPVLQSMTKLLRQYRSLDAFGQFINMRTGSDHRMRASFSPTTETFRYRSSTDAFGYGRNLQNLPTGNEEDE